MRHTIKALLLLAGMLLQSCSAVADGLPRGIPAPIPQGKDDFSAVTKQIQGWIDKGYYPGAAILIAKDNRIVYEKCFGSYTPDTVVLIASAGKWLAAATIMSVVEAGKLSLDDRASKWLPEFKNDPKGKATLRQMLSPRGVSPESFRDWGRRPNLLHGVKVCFRTSPETGRKVRDS
jgi:CubicO group peptidase (beta-lactamase class C family)